MRVLDGKPWDWDRTVMQRKRKGRKGKKEGKEESAKGSDLSRRVGKRSTADYKGMLMFVLVADVTEKGKRGQGGAAFGMLKGEGGL
jgi:hypothetical protein